VAHATPPGRRSASVATPASIQNSQGWDHLAGKFVNGDWQERGRLTILSDAPPLGVEVNAAPDGKREERITTFVPGMILNLKLPYGQAKRRE
jgi:hypothetical protein